MFQPAYSKRMLRLRGSISSDYVWIMNASLCHEAQLLYPYTVIHGYPQRGGVCMHVEGGLIDILQLHSLLYLMAVRLV